MVLKSQYDYDSRQIALKIDGTSQEMSYDAGLRLTHRAIHEYNSRLFACLEHPSFVVSYVGTYFAKGSLS